MPKNPSKFKDLCNISYVFYGKKKSDPCPTPPPKLDDQPLLAVHNCLLNTFRATLSIWRLPPAFTTQWHAMQW